MLTVPARKLEEWASTYQAQAELPRWIARLIGATCEGLTRLEMPGGEHIHLAGFDGLVECTVGDDLVPAGTSAWELSVERDVKGKADYDFDRRSGDPVHLEKGKVTFVFSTPRKWAAATRWAQEKQAAGWKDVRVVWSSHLERWFERAPWLAAAFLESIGEGPVGLESLEMIWAAYQRVPAPAPLSPDFVIGERPEVGNRFVEWMRAAPEQATQTIRVAGSSHKEIFHYLVASLRNIPADVRTTWEARVFAVHTEQAALGLGRLNRSHIVLVASGLALGPVLRAQHRSGCRVVIVDTTPADAPVQPAPGIECIRLGVAGENIWIRSLLQSGFSAEEAAALCRHNGCDYERLRRAAFLS